MRLEVTHRGAGFRRERWISVHWKRWSPLLEGGIPVTIPKARPSGNSPIPRVIDEETSTVGDIPTRPSSRNSTSSFFSTSTSSSIGTAKRKGRKDAPSFAKGTGGVRDPPPPPKKEPEVPRCGHCGMVQPVNGCSFCDRKMRSRSESAKIHGYCRCTDPAPKTPKFTRLESVPEPSHQFSSVDLAKLREEDAKQQERLKARVESLSAAWKGGVRNSQSFRPPGY